MVGTREIRGNQQMIAWWRNTREQESELRNKLYSPTSTPDTGCASANRTYIASGTVAGCVTGIASAISEIDVLNPGRRANGDPEFIAGFGSKRTSEREHKLKQHCPHAQYRHDKTPCPAGLSTLNARSRIWPHADGYPFWIPLFLSGLSRLVIMTKCLMCL